METYDVDFFLKKFEAIPENMWHTHSYSNATKTKFCAFGHCGVTDRGNSMSFSMDVMFYKELKVHVSHVNDGREINYPQPTPKQRILAALRDIKAKLQPGPVKEVPVKERTVYVTVDAAVRKLQKEIAEN